MFFFLRKHIFPGKSKRKRDPYSLSLNPQYSNTQTQNAVVSSISIGRECIMNSASSGFRKSRKKLLRVSLDCLFSSIVWHLQKEIWPLGNMSLLVMRRRI
ncbi:hypothetical protein CMV_013414 [Castanea mollissima]|uniref:Uncharacterized protein n=1 Tax=Castanea mollissima TaxID=60419 RepID=A0A8J4VVN0_9ROSI|nr:hypothetical protein CMV_013414 [Castanea mollissima]